MSQKIRVLNSFEGPDGNNIHGGRAEEGMVEDDPAAGLGDFDFRDGSDTHVAREGVATSPVWITAQGGASSRLKHKARSNAADPCARGGTIYSRLHIRLRPLYLYACISFAKFVQI